ncbi:MAG: type II toxin-antitoxin system RelE/ParE family toxin [Rhizobiaceae bacterium]
MKVIFTTSAKADLRSIALYIAQDNVKRAKSFSKELRVCYQKLSEQPLRFARVPGFNNIRKRAYGNNLIYYRVKAQSIDILHIFHGAQDIDETDLLPAGAKDS